MLVPLAGLVGGIIMAAHGTGFLVGIVLIIAGILVYELLSHIMTDAINAWRVRRFHYIWVCLIFMGAGVILTDLRRVEPIDSDELDSSTAAYGVVRDIANTTSGDRILLELTAVADSLGNVKACSPVGMIAVIDGFNAKVGDYLEIPCRIKPLTVNPNGFDTEYPARMARKGILYRAETALYGSPKIYEVKDRDIQTRFHSTLWNLRISYEEFIEKTYLSKPVQNFLITLLLGDRSYLDEGTRTLFADAGISHVLALSGMHVSIIAGILLWLLYPFNFVGLYQWRYLLSVPALWAYTMLTGASPSTVRAAIMATIMVLCLLLERKNSGWNSLLLATFIILLLNPSALFDFGLQLSFVCVASLIFFARPLNPVNHRKHPFLYSIASALIVSMVATFGSWTLISFYFGSVPLFFLPANVICLPLLPVYMVLALIYFLLVGIGYYPELLGSLLDDGYSLLTAFLEILKGDGMTVWDISVPFVTVVLWLAAMSMLAVWFHLRRSRMTMVLAVSLAVIALIVIPVAARDNNGIIITSHADRPRIVVKNGSTINDYTFLANSVSEIRIGDVRIGVADCSSENVQMPPGCDVLIITRGCTDSIHSIIRNLHPRKLVIHTSVRRKREQQLIKQADSLGIPIHSIRLQNPLRMPYTN